DLHAAREASLTRHGPSERGLVCTNQARDRRARRRNLLPPSQAPRPPDEGRSPISKVPTRTRTLVPRTLFRVAVGAALVAALAAVPLGPRPTQAAPAALAIGWSKGASLPTSFSPRWDFATGYLPTKDQVVLFGGSPRKVNGDDWRDDTWIYDGS